MSRSQKSIVIISLSVAVTFFATAYYVRHSTRASSIDEFVNMEAFNDVGRLENYDTLEDLLKRGCNKEALEFVQIQQTLLLFGLKRHMAWGDQVRDNIIARNQEVARRAKALSSRQRTFVIPTCN